MTDTRITRRLAKLKQENRAGLVTFTMAYDPDYATSLGILKALPAAGADIVELGMPFSDPMADGPSIEAAGQRAIAAGATMAGIFRMVTEFRTGNAETPLILMGYYNPLAHYGMERFVTDAKQAGVDGLIIVDLPPEEDKELHRLTAAASIALIKLVTPTTNESRLQKILPSASGFLYYVSVAGITGAAAATTDSVRQALARFRKATDLPLAVGFGIKTPEQVKEIGAIADLVVVGSALVQEIAESPKGKAQEKAIALVKALAGKKP